MLEGAPCRKQVVKCSVHLSRVSAWPSTKGTNEPTTASVCVDMSRTAFIVVKEASGPNSLAEDRNCGSQDIAL